VVLSGAGDSNLNNTGTINGSGVAVQLNAVAGSTQTFNNTGNGSINGNFAGPGDGQIVIVNESIPGSRNSWARDLSRLWRCARQQDGPHGLGAAGPWWHLSSA
jgi:hypothetical protein